MTNIVVDGAAGIRAEIIADSVNMFGNRMTTFELTYPRFIHSELMTHRLLSKNAASSRAIPLKKMAEVVKETPAVPVWWGKNQSGMQAKEELGSDEIIRAAALWDSAKNSALHYLEEMDNIGLHKQIACRITEPWFMMKTILSGTEFANLYHLRDHADAQPEFWALAKTMRKAHELSVPSILEYNEWHLPYVTRFKDANGLTAYKVDNQLLSLEEAKQISVSCCAQVSYRKRDESLDKAKSIYEKLVKAEVMHASPFEHLATPMPFVKLQRSNYIDELPAGISHVTRDGMLWSGNLQGWIQFRKLMPNEAVWDVHH